MKAHPRRNNQEFKLIRVMISNELVLMSTPEELKIRLPKMAQKKSKMSNILQTNLVQVAMERKAQELQQMADKNLICIRPKKKPKNQPEQINTINTVSEPMRKLKFEPGKTFEII